MLKLDNEYWGKAYVFGTLFPIETYQKIATLQASDAPPAFVDAEGLTEQEARSKSGGKGWSDLFARYGEEDTSPVPTLKEVQSQLWDRVLWLADPYILPSESAKLLVHRGVNGSIDSILVDLGYFSSDKE